AGGERRVGRGLGLGGGPRGDGGGGERARDRVAGGLGRRLAVGDDRGGVGQQLVGRVLTDLGVRLGGVGGAERPGDRVALADGVGGGRAGADGRRRQRLVRRLLGVRGAV